MGSWSNKQIFIIVVLASFCLCSPFAPAQDVSPNQQAVKSLQVDDESYFRELKKEKQKDSLIFTLLLLIIFAGVGIYLAVIERKKKLKQQIAASIKSAYALQNKHVQHKMTKMIQQSDPGFSKDVLCERIWLAFKQFQVAWAQQDMSSVRHFLSDGIYEQYKLLLEILKNSHVKREKKNIDIRNIRVGLMEVDDFFHTIHFQITAQAVDYYASTENESVVYAQDHPGIFSEFWTFKRRIGTETLKQPGLFESYCPACHLKLNDTGKTTCPSCNIVLNTGNHDWVLCNIVQGSEWNLKPRTELKNLEQLRAVDPLFNWHHINDRIKAIFYNHIAAQFFADKKMIESFVSSDFLAKYDDLYQPLPSGEHSFYADANLGAIEIREYCSAEGDGSLDRLRLKVKWYAHKEVKMVPSLIIPAFDSCRLFLQEFILCRKKGVTSTGDNILNSVHCPVCGAQITKFRGAECSSCHSCLNDGSCDWVLDDIHDLSYYSNTENPFDAMEYKSKIFGECNLSLSVFDDESLMAAIAAVMYADSDVDPREEELLKYVGRIKRITPKKLDSIVNSVKDGHFSWKVPRDRESASQFLSYLIQMCLVDGKVAPSEKSLLELIMGKMGYSSWDIDSLINEEQQRIYKKSQKILAELQ